MIAIPGFVIIAGVRDHTAAGTEPTKRSHDLYRSAVSLFFIYLAMNYLSEVVSNLYAASGTACSSASMQRLWFSCSSCCRFIRATILILRFEPACRYRGRHGSCLVAGEGLIKQLNEVVKAILLDANSSVDLYFVLSPTVPRLRLPRSRRRLSGKKRACMILFACAFMRSAVFRISSQVSRCSLKRRSDR